MLQDPDDFGGLGTILQNAALSLCGFDNGSLEEFLVPDS